MIVAYINDAQYERREEVAAAVGLQRDGMPFKITFRDPAKFEPPDADVLDTVVYVAEGRRAQHSDPDYNGPQHRAYQIRKAYEAFPGTRVLSLDASPLPGLPMEVIPRELRPVRPAPAEVPLVDGVPLLGMSHPATAPEPPVESIGVVKRRAADLEAKRLEEERRKAEDPLREGLRQGDLAGASVAGQTR